VCVSWRPTLNQPSEKGLVLFGGLVEGFKIVDGLSITGGMTFPRRRLIPLFALFAVALLFAIPVLAAKAAENRCAYARSGETCGPGNGRQTPGGGEKVSHKGWPAVTGVLWKVLDSGSHRKVGGPGNDELLGHHGSDAIAGDAGEDILWGDWDPHANNARQRDVLRGGAGDDFIYPSHGASAVYGGPGRDYIWAFYGHGTIDCGPGRDTVRVRMNGAFKLRNCEVVNHFCSFGSDGHGGCLKPGEKARRRG
jgi:hypothetical protein